MFGTGGEPRRMSIDTDQLTINSRAVVIADPSITSPMGVNSPFPREEVQQRANDINVESVFSNSKKLEDDMQQLGEKIKHHEDNINYLKSLKNKLEDSIVDFQVAIGKQRANSCKEENGTDTNVNSEEETVQRIMMHEKSAAALLCRIKSEAQFADNLLTKDVIGVVATLGKVDDANLSRLLSEYLGLETMLAVVCKSYDGAKLLEKYDKDGRINNALGIHQFAASVGMNLDDRFHVICLENLRPYAGELIADDPQRRLKLLKPKLMTGETPPGFLGFAVNMVAIDNSNLFFNSKSGHTLRETLFYNLFMNLQVYESRDDMLKAQPFITTGAISLDGGMIKRPGILSLGPPGDVDVKFPYESKKSALPANCYELENQIKESKWKKERALEDIQREQEQLDHAKFKYEAKKKEFVRFLAESSSYLTQASADVAKEQILPS